jgi:VCBS repeat-containing protein
MRPTRILAWLAPALLSLGLACTDVTGNTVGTALYAYDGASGQVLVWDDVSALYATGSASAATAATSPSRTLSGNAISSVASLGWGGMAFDSATNRLYLVSSTGTVVRVENASSASGSLSSTMDVVKFTLGASSDRLSSGTFGQAAVDSTGSYLYVTESNSTTVRIWKVGSPMAVTNGSTVSLNDVAVSTDTAGSVNGVGVAAGTSGALFGYFQNGSDIQDASNTIYFGPRLRYGSGSFSSSSSVLIGDQTHLERYGALAFDYNNSRLFVAVHTADAGVSTAPILVYRTGAFTSGYNQSPDMTLSASGLTNLRILAHPGKKNWLVGAESTNGAGTNKVWIWNTPLNAPDPEVFTLDSGVEILGLAMDGSK